MNKTIEIMKILDDNGELKKFFKIAYKYKINDLDIFTELFHSYISSRDIKYNYKYISCSSFNYYILKFKYGISI